MAHYSYGLYSYGPSTLPELECQLLPDGPLLLRLEHRVQRVEMLVHEEQVWRRGSEVPASCQLSFCLWPIVAMAYTVMAYIVMACIVMAC